MTYPQILLYIILTAATAGIVFLVGYMMLGFSAHVLNAWFQAKKEVEEVSKI